MNTDSQRQSILRSRSAAADTLPFLTTMAALVLLACCVGCMCPGHLGTKTTRVSLLVEQPGVQLHYQGSDEGHHYFVRQNCYSLFAPGQWAVTDKFRLAKQGYRAREEFELTTDRMLWRSYSIDEIEKLERDFIKQQPTLLP